MNLGAILDECELLNAYGETCRDAVGVDWFGLAVIALCVVGVLLWARR